MLRVTPVESRNRLVTLRLEGRVSGPWVNELREVCEKAMADGKRLALNLAEVSFLDSAAIGLLKALQTHGVELMDCSMFVKEQLKAARLGAQPTGRAGQQLVSE